MILTGILVVLTALAVAGIIYSPQPRVPFHVWWAGGADDYHAQQRLAAELERLEQPETIMLAPQQLREREVAA
ncbi:hypothetical protein ACMT4L_16830 [Deinococcus sp. A31D244]|uniref:hypothetical protein n=1 Tax=Deinococcus sp. A31D244 TaxID=3397675 RepID=UPI0039E1907E